MGYTAEWAVDNGIELLNKKEPYWRDKIDRKKFDVSSSDWCVLGQVFGVYSRGLRKMFGSDLPVSYNVEYELAGMHGFCVASDIDRTPSYGELTEEWLSRFPEDDEPQEVEDQEDEQENGCSCGRPGCF